MTTCKHCRYSEHYQTVLHHGEAIVFCFDKDRPVREGVAVTCESYEREPGADDEK